MDITLVRHGEPEWVRAGLQVDDPPLTTRGREQAHRLAPRLAAESFDDIYVSPLTRARQTAAPMLAAVGRDEVIGAWLEEIRNPIWHGTPAEKVDEAYQSDRARPAHERWEGLPGGESVRDFVDRIRNDATIFLKGLGIERSHPDLPVWSIESVERRVLFVAHAGTNSVFTCLMLGLDPTPWEWDRFVMGHASVTRLEALPVGGGFTFSLTQLSDVEHLSPDMRTR